MGTISTAQSVIERNSERLTKIASCLTKLSQKDFAYFLARDSHSDWKLM